MSYWRSTHFCFSSVPKVVLPHLSHSLPHLHLKGGEEGSAKAITLFGPLILHSCLSSQIFTASTGSVKQLFF